jgi:hypothetical protein
MLLLLPSAAEAAPPQPPQGTEFQKLSASTDHLVAGEEVLVTGDGCAGGDQVRFELYDPQLDSSASTVANTDGTFVQRIRVPTSAQVGRAWLRASCRTPESSEKILQAVLLISRPAFVITWINVLFGVGTFLMVWGLLLALLRRHHSRRVRRRPKKARGYRSRRRGRTVPRSRSAPSRAARIGNAREPEHSR